MTINATIHVHFHLPSGSVTDLDLSRLEARLMSALSDKIAEVRAALDEAIGRVQEDVDDLNAKVAELQAKVDAGTASQADLDALDSLKADLAAIDPTKPDTLPEQPGT